MVFLQAALTAQVLKFEKFGQLNVTHNPEQLIWLLDSGAEVNPHDSEGTAEENPQQLQGVSVSGFIGGSRPVTKKAMVKPPSVEDVKITSIDVPGSKYTTWYQSDYWNKAGTCRFMPNNNNKEKYEPNIEIRLPFKLWTSSSLLVGG